MFTFSILAEKSIAADQNDNIQQQQEQLNKIEQRKKEIQKEVERLKQEQVDYQKSLQKIQQLLASAENEMQTTRKLTKIL